METFLIKAAQLVLALALLIVVHEFGHYIFARIFGIRVEKFYLFFNPWFSLFKWKPREPAARKPDRHGNPRASWRDTTYGIGWVPLGGYCKIAGMIDESMDKEQMAQPARHDEFRSKPAWQRLLVMIGGVLFNFILAIIIYAGIAWYWGERAVPYETAYAGMLFCDEMHEAGFSDGDVLLMCDGKPIDVTSRSHIYDMLESDRVTVLRDGRDTVVITMPDDLTMRLADNEDGIMTYRLPVSVKEVVPGEPAGKAGLQPGDRITAVNGVATPGYDLFMPELQKNAGREVTLSVIRDNDTIAVKAVPTEGGKLGFGLNNFYEVYPYKDIRYNVFESVPKGIGNGCEMMGTYVGSLKHVFSREGAKSIGGFGAIGNLFPAHWDWRTFWEMCAFLSIILAFMNILPIPALDGGHVLFLLVELCSGRKPSDKFLEYAQMAGMAFLFALLVFANFNDIYRFFIK